MDRPTLPDIISNLQTSDFVLMGAFWTFGIIGGFVVGRAWPGMYQKMSTYSFITHASNVTGVSMALAMSYQRLVGFQDNGLRWSNPDKDLKFYDFTSEFEKQSFFGRFRKN